MLSRSPDTITVGEVLRYVKGDNDRSQNKKLEGENPFAALWSQLDDQISAIIDQTTFGELARNWQEQKSKDLPNWDI
jgi:DNA-binding IscR family transcriptional regulator